MRAMFRTLVPILALMAASAGAFAATTAGEAGARLDALFQSEWERGLREDPLAATYSGDRGAIPLDVLEANVNRWISERPAAAQLAR